MCKPPARPVVMICSLQNPCGPFPGPQRILIKTIWGLSGRLGGSVSYLQRLIFFGWEVRAFAWLHIASTARPVSLSNVKACSMARYVLSDFGTGACPRRPPGLLSTRLLPGGAFFAGLSSVDGEGESLYSITSESPTGPAVSPAGWEDAASCSGCWAAGKTPGSSPGSPPGGWGWSPSV